MRADLVFHSKSGEGCIAIEGCCEKTRPTANFDHHGMMWGVKAVTRRLAVD